ncbi:acyl-CoA carboxylase subunit beta [Nocardioides humilatus]|uniref:Acyl-CoA carboxylase subunit beta n=1 Tax=Nocardioides humilatus TaxID=2607660 RepID=A0A5B1LB97_9ACTN|nr:acyl-CoA carboxylase subunit beta [Nocardioides humilatus]KAA1416959.1 acyl-CoA carboxylase subunit beta [Nocardioides humilatus]
MATDLYDELDRRLAAARRGGPQAARDKHRAAGKLLVRERLQLLLDDIEEFEDGLLARHLEDLPADGVVTCVGHVDGRRVCVIANDYTVKAGAWGKRTFEKITRMQLLADELGVPLVYLVDAAGARIDEQFESYAGRHAWGNIFYNQVQISGRVPQICALFGPSPAGAAYVPALCDVTIMVKGTATAYIGSPRVAEMVTGESVSLEEMGGAELHARVSGLADVMVATEVEAIDAVRLYLSYLPASWEQQPPRVAARPPRDVGPLRDVVPANEATPYDVHLLIDGIVDADSFFEHKELFAPELVTGFARIDGSPIGIVANQSSVKAGVLFSDSSDKAARFVWMCNAYNVPLLFLVDVPGYMLGTVAERDGIIRHGAKMLFAVAESRVPRIAVIVRKAYGGGYLGMSGSPMNPDAVLALPTAKPALLGPEAAIAGVHYNRAMAIEDEAERQRFVAALRAEYAEKVDVFQIANENAVEAVVPVEDLRGELASRFRVYRDRRKPEIRRRNGVYPV